MSNVDKVPKYYPDTNKHISFIQSICVNIFFCFFGGDLPKEQQVYYS